MRSLGVAILAALLAESAIAHAGSETTIIPFVGGTSDAGFGIGAIGSLARVEPGGAPFVWRLEFATMTTARYAPFVIPFQDDYLVLTVPQLVPGVLRLEVRPSFTHETLLNYSGVGNASPPPDFSLGREHNVYTRMHPSLMARARLSLVGPLFLQTGIRYTYNHIDFAADSVLARDLATGSPVVKDALVGTTDHSVVEFDDGLVLDTRDDEVSPTSGQFHLVQIRLAPGGPPALPYRWGAFTTDLRGYVSPLGRRLTFAGRAVFDWEFGDVPFYELARFEDLYAIGGTTGVRGVIAQRYYGRLKLLGNLEARTEVFSLRLFQKETVVGFVAFFDAGRVWLEARPNPELDGTGLGLKFGTGGGLRIRAGQSFVVRADVAYSPDANPVSFYFQGNQAF